MLLPATYLTAVKGHLQDWLSVASHSDDGGIALKLLLTAAEQLTGQGRARLRAGLTAGDPAGEVAVAWQGKELLRAVYAAVGTAAARAVLERL